MIADGNVNAIYIATPPSSHHDLAMQCLPTKRCNAGSGHSFFSVRSGQSFAPSLAFNLGDFRHFFLFFGLSVEAEQRSWQTRLYRKALSSILPRKQSHRRCLCYGQCSPLCGLLPPRPGALPPDQRDCENPTGCGDERFIQPFNADPGRGRERGESSLAVLLLNPNPITL